ncbi:membrane protease subunit (stomatin/prohibitin family) [Mycetocola sp. BIGb0189]|uniref:SPFH domain-containing protein n=1 Tax=Mycetocola sp. BIGb0189 TaxID=2940604 RepID=UPI00216A44DA|nr:SPFH domain-containing protein [Mycetocola sp. BIGb0189]MCS4276211.1 membrane protease subunit (stomatin/prohibitin family) [Mycetocola sp. BIGb0189]
MGIIQAFTGALGGTFADQWKDIITTGPFTEHTVVSPGVYQQTNTGRGTNFRGSADVISNGSKILVPENTAAFIFSQAGIEDVVTQAGGYEYRAGQPSMFAGDGFTSSIVRQTVDRVGYGGQTSDLKYLAFVNLREIRGLKFGTRGPMVYHDRFYGADLELLSFGTFSLRVVNAVTFVRNFLPANARYYAFDGPEARRQISSEFMQAFLVAVNSLSATHRISELPSQAGAIAELIADDDSALGSWITRYGLDVVQVGIESIEFSPESRELVNRYSANKMNVSAFEGVSQQASNVAAQMKVAQGVQDHGLGDGGGMLMGMNLAQAINPLTAAPVVAPSAPAASLSLDEQIEIVKKLKDLVDAGVLSQDEFNAKKKQVMGL